MEQNQNLVINNFIQTNLMNPVSDNYLWNFKYKNYQEEWTLNGSQLTVLKSNNKELLAVEENSDHKKEAIWIFEDAIELCSFSKLSNSINTPSIYIALNPKNNMLENINKISHIIKQNSFIYSIICLKDTILTKELKNMIFNLDSNMMIKQVEPITDTWQEDFSLLLQHQDIQSKKERLLKQLDKK